jgi:hypothetical protein
LIGARGFEDERLDAGRKAAGLKTLATDGGCRDVGPAFRTIFSYRQEIRAGFLLTPHHG